MTVPDVKLMMRINYWAGSSAFVSLGFEAPPETRKLSEAWYVVFVIF